MTRLRLGVVGVGHLGKVHARILAGLPDVELAGVADVSLDQARAVAAQHGTVAFGDHRELLDKVDAAVIAVPTCHHLAVARAFLTHGIPLLIEKPLAVNRAEAEAIVALAEETGTLVQVGHVERFNPAFEELQRRPIRPKFVECVRASTFTGRSTDIGAVLDIMIHDLDLLLTLVGSPVENVEALGVTVFGGHEDLVNARLTFADGCIAHVTASRLHPEPVRSMRVWAAEGFAAIDFGRRTLTLAQPSAEIRRHGLNVGRMPPAARMAIKDELFRSHVETVTLDCNHGDQLTRELEDFVGCLRHGTTPRVTGRQALEAMLLADRILASVHSHRWEARPDGPTGPANLPAPLGSLFLPEQRQAAA